MDAQNRVIFIGADEKARSDDRAIILRLRINMLDAINTFDDGFERTRDKLNGIIRPPTIGLHDDIHHWHADLRLFFAWQRNERDDANDQRPQKQKRR